MGKKQKYDQLAEKILELIGGKDNISNFVHCMTRLRFNLKDNSIVNMDEIKHLSGIVGAQWSNDQLQIIIGSSVADVYKVICEKANYSNGESICESLDKKKGFSFAAIIDGLAGSLVPILPIMIGAGMLKVIVILCELMGILTIGNPTHTVLTFAADSGFYFLPIFLGATAATKFKTNMGLGMLIGAILLHPTFTSNVGENIGMSIFGLPIYATNYANSIFPVIIAVYIMSYVEKFFRKIAPEAIKVLFVPLATTLIMLPLTLCLIGPAGAFLGVYLAQAIMWLYNTVGFLGVAVLAALYPLLIVTGMHGALVPYMFQSFATFGFEPIVCTACVLSNIGQGAAAAAVSLKSKDKELKSTAASSAITAVVGGVTEPALFGVNLRFKTPLYACMVGNFIGAAFAGIMKVYSYAFAGSAGIFGIAGFVGPTSMNFIYMAISMVITFVSTFIITLLVYKGEKA